jgi:hypothetical protein
MCGRLTAVMDLARTSDASLSRDLGYANATTLAAVRRGAVFPDAERLAKLGQLELFTFATPNLHWILTGVGKAFLPGPRCREADTAQLDALNQLATAATAAIKGVR